MDSVGYDYRRLSMVVHTLGTFVYAPPECKRDNIILLPDEEAHHLKHVLRVKQGAGINATDGAGLVHRCTLSDENQLIIEDTIPEFGEPPVQITLAVGVLKGDGNRDIVDAATQLGVRRIFFIQSVRSEGQISENKLMRLQRVAVSAIKQCGRAWLPRISTVDSVTASLRQLPDSTRILAAQQLDEAGKKDARDEVRERYKSITVYVGPEGGFNESELELLTATGAEYLHLGNRRLRTGIAVNAALSYCLRLAGEVG